MDLSLQTKIVTGAQIEPFIPELARLRCEVFPEYPYLYVGDKKYEEWYLENYAKQPHSFLLLLLQGSKVIGCSSGMPLADEKHEAFPKALSDHGYNVDEVFLYGESLIQKEFRGQGFGHVFFAEREKYVRSFGGRFKSIAFFAIERELNDPRRPQEYRDLFELWQSKGFYKTDINVYFPYQEIGEKEESPKKMVFWIKNL